MLALAKHGRHRRRSRRRRALDNAAGAGILHTYTHTQTDTRGSREEMGALKRLESTFGRRSEAHEA